MKHILRSDIDQMEKRFRANFINSLSGFKSANLVGTKSADGQSNVSIVSSVIHLGSNPPLLGMVMRPPSVPRHSYENILETKVFTLNHVGKDFFIEAHQTSARYEKEESEFKATGLAEEYLNGWAAPSVGEASIKMGMHLVEDVHITHNDTRFIIAEIEWVQLEEELVKQDGFVDLFEAEGVCISGLDSYHSPASLGRLEYAKADQPIRFKQTKQ
ncbi:MAG: flavin reductase (DIM6/NTAB) family NADH-FMN oxidoreductase RutF [Flavobacteriales bacterium]|jgi:flavin reductase (DIM6/NTAB) family NADH-FMN oxidoreductase RutF